MRQPLKRFSVVTMSSSQLIDLSRQNSVKSSITWLPSFSQISSIQSLQLIWSSHWTMSSTACKWVEVVDEFYKPFAVELEKAETEIEKIQIKDEPAGFDCDVYGHPMVIKLGKYGKFYACSTLPDCRNTMAIVKEIGVVCPTCHEGQVIERKSKRNRIFYGCARYPDCESTSWDKPIGRDCPKCVDSSWLRRKFVAEANRLFVAMYDYEDRYQVF